MSWLLIGGALAAAWMLLRGKGAPVGGVPASKPIDPAPESFENGIEVRARLKELDLLAEAQAKFNLQRRFDLIAKANKAANPSEGAGPKE